MKIILQEIKLTFQFMILFHKGCIKMKNLRIIELNFSDCELNDSRVIFLIDILFNLADNLVEYSIDL
jgi:hypothetical protein